MKKIIAVLLSLVMTAAVFGAAAVNAADPDPSQWLCEAGGPVATGWWIKDITADNRDSIDVKFTATSVFSGITFIVYANTPDDAKGHCMVKVELVNSKNKTVYKCAIDASHERGYEMHVLDFGKAYAKGEYTFRLICTGTGDYFSLGSSRKGPSEVQVTGGTTDANTLVDPIILLTGAVPPGEEPEDDETEPATDEVTTDTEEVTTAEQTDAQTDEQTDAQSDAQTDAQTDEQTAEQTEADDQTDAAGDQTAEDPATDAAATDAETEAEEKTVNPKTADAAIIAIASVAAIALAGVVIAKKLK